MQSDDDQRERSSGVRLVYSLLALITLVASGLLAVLWGSTKDTLEYEAAKGCIGILTVALVGFVVSIAVQTVQRDRARRDTAADRANAKKERDAQQRSEEFQRDLEQQREFKSGASIPIDSAIEDLRNALGAPLDIPQANRDEQAFR